MNHLKRFSRDVTTRSFLAALAPGAAATATYFTAQEFFGTDAYVALLAGSGILIVLAILSYLWLTAAVVPPIEKLWQAVWHISPRADGVAAPRVDELSVGRTLVSGMVREIYDMAAGTVANSSKDGSSPTKMQAGVLALDSLPVPVFIMDKEQVVTFCNSAGMTFVDLPKEKIIGKKLYDVLRMSFQTEHTLELWQQEVIGKRATATGSWSRIRLTTESYLVRQFDMAASYSQNHPDGNELILTLFDHTDAYAKEDEAASYVSLAVHELRTPLTLLRGYIEVFEDELGNNLTPELQAFMRKMRVASQTLTAFVSNILNVARIDEDQFILHLHEAEWGTVLPEIIADLELRASVRGKHIELDIAPNLPKVGIDKISMYEVLNNLVENAIKYSGNATKIVVHARVGKDGTIETVVEDFGVGIPQNAMGSLFTKYYRSHRSKNNVSGTGLGLYLVKAIVSAHGGHVWAESKEGQGSSFGFSLQPYEAIKDTPHAKGQDGIERQASGWIKNHSLYRR